MYSAQRVEVYIHGLNLYFGMTSSFPDIKWLDVELLAKNLLKSNQTLVSVKYFTSLVNHSPQKEKRQQSYLNALKTTDINIIYGHYKSKPKSCKSCGHSWSDNEEKMTDVNIAVHMVADAIDDLFDCAILISGDSDLVPPITLIHSKFKNKRVTVIFPPNRHNNSVKNVAKGAFILGKQKLKQSQFPDQIPLKNGFILHKPNEWK